MLFPSPDPVRVEESAFKGALRHFASGVTIITTYDESGTPYGMTATAFSSLSLRPPLILVAIGRATRCHAHLTATKRFGVSVLHDRQSGISRYFGGQALQNDEPPRFGSLADTPVIEAAMVKLACDLDKVVDGGDHTIFIGRVKAAALVPGQPLVHFDGGYHRLAAI